MKKQILSFLFVLSAVLLISTSTYAQSDRVYVAKGFSSLYDIALDANKGVWTGTIGTNYTVTWSITTGSAGVEWSGTGAANALVQNSLSNTITWNTVGDYVIRIIATDANGCKTEPIDLTVHVLDTQFCLGSGANAPNNTTTCSLITTNTNGNNSSLPSNHTFTVDISGTIAGDYTINYTVSSPGNTSYTGSEIVTATTSAQKEITFNQISGNLLALFTNTANTDKTVTVTINNIIDPNNNTITANCGTVSYTINVRETPVISF